MCFYHAGIKQTIKLSAVILACGLVPASCMGPAATKAPVRDSISTIGPALSAPSIDDMIAELDPVEAILALDNAATGSNPDKAFAMLVKAAEIAINHTPGQAVDERIKALYRQYPKQDRAVRITILKNRALLSRKKTGQATESLDRLLPLATPREKLLIQSLKAEALLQAGFPIKSVQARIALDNGYRQYAPEKLITNDMLLWNSLMQTRPDIISGHISEVPNIFSGWLELTHIRQRYQFDSAALNTKTDTWAAHNPDHPANRHIIAFIKRKQNATSAHPERVALLLPLTGKLAPVGNAVRDGLISAYLESNRRFGTQVKIDIYDTQGDAERAGHIVRLANDRGARFIVGPLDKAAVTVAIAANRATGTTTGMLTLNRATNNLPEDNMATSVDKATAKTNQTIYQMDLAPENEAMQVAERASIEGFGYAMVIAPDNAWGNRMYESFAQRYQQLGGYVVALHRFQKGSADFSAGIRQNLKLNISKIRHRQIESLLRRNIGFTPRRRQDINMIFIASAPHEARLIKPQLKFFYADDIPVYATSSVYSGNTDPAHDKDLEGIRFCDMPWLLTSKPAPGSLQSAVFSAWLQGSAKYLRFYTLGADAFRLLPQMEWLKENNSQWISGGTGRLSLNASGIVQRKLSWAVFKQAIPKLDHEFSN